MGTATTDVLLALAYLTITAVIPGVATYLIVRRDLDKWGTALATAGCAVAVSVTSWFGFVFSLFAFAAAAVVYLVLRRTVRIGPALILSAVALAGGLAGSVLVMMRTLDNMG